MDSNKQIFEKLQAELAPFKGTLVLSFFDVVKLVGVNWGDDDFYWIYDTSKGIVYSTCVASWVSLKDKLEKKDYERMVSIWNMNHIESAI